METIFSFMSRDHDRLDGIFQQFKEKKRRQPQEAKKDFMAFLQGLLKHIEWEEKTLFPLFEEKTGMKENGPTAVMRLEHDSIKAYLLHIEKLVQEDDFNTDSYEEQLLEMLHFHNLKEEDILYPMIDSMLSEKELQDTIYRMR